MTGWRPLWPTKLHDFEYCSSAVTTQFHREAQAEFFTVWSRGYQSISLATMWYIYVFHNYIIRVCVKINVVVWLDVLRQVVSCGTCSRGRLFVRANAVCLWCIARHGIDDNALQLAYRRSLLRGWRMLTQRLVGIHQCRWLAATGRIYSPKWPQSNCSTRFAKDCGLIR